VEKERHRGANGKVKRPSKDVSEEACKHVGEVGKQQQPHISTRMTDRAGESRDVEIQRKGGRVFGVTKDRRIERLHNNVQRLN